MTERIPVTIVYPGPSPHAVDFFTALDADRRFDMEVLFCLPRFVSRGGWPVPKMMFPHEFLPSRRLSNRGEFMVWNTGLVSRVVSGARRGRIHLVGGGYTMPSVAMAMLALNRMRARWYSLSEKPGISGRPVKKLLRTMLIRLCLGGCSGILAHSPIAMDAYRNLGFSDSLVNFLPYYMRVEEFLQVQRCWDGIAGHPLRILYFGGLQEIKGVDWALRVIAGMRDDMGKFTLTIAGAGELEQELRRLVHDGSLSNVRFIGSVPWEERWKTFAEHDVLLLPSRHDGWGMVVMEALASGMGVLGSENSGAVQAYVRDDVNGLKFPYGDDEALRETLRRCFNDPSRVASWGEAARSSIQDWRPECGVAILHDLLAR